MNKNKTNWNQSWGTKKRKHRIQKIAKKLELDVSIDRKNRFYIDGEFVSKKNIKDELITKLSKSNKRVIILRSDSKVPIEEIVYLMDIANKNSIKVVLAVKEK